MSVRSTTLEEWEKPKNLKQVTEWARAGLTNIQIAHNIGIVEQTLYKWKHKSPAFTQALEEGKAVINQHVVNKSLELIQGFEYDEVTEVRDAQGNLVETKTVKKRALPDRTMMIFWLKNRLPKDFRDTQLTEAQAKKLEVETAILEKQLSALNGDETDMTMLKSLMEIKGNFK